MIFQAFRKMTKWMRRKKPLKSGGALKRSPMPLLRRSKLRHTSRKTAKAQRAIAGDRAEYRSRYYVCPWTGRTGSPTIHEILGGSSRANTVKDPRYWLPADWWFHTEVLQHESRARQWARKKWLNDGHYDEAAVNEIRGKGCDLAEIESELVILRAEMGREFFRG